MPTPIVPPTPDNTPAPFSAEPALLAGQPDLPPDARPCPPGYTYTLVRRNADRTLAEYPADLFASKALQRALDRQTAPDVRVRHPSDAELLAPLIGRMRQEGRWLAKAKPGSETEFSPRGSCLAATFSAASQRTARRRRMNRRRRNARTRSADRGSARMYRSASTRPSAGHRPKRPMWNARNRG